MTTAGPIVGLVDSDLLAPFTVVQVPAVKAFSAVDRFCPGKTDGLEIGSISESFIKLIESYGDRKIAVDETHVRIHSLRMRAGDSQIIEQLGGENARISIAHTHGMMKEQGRGESGHLLTNCGATIHFPEEFPGQAVYYYWSSTLGIWMVDAGPVVSPCVWPVGSRVLSR